MTTELIEIEIPDEFLQLASDWYCGQGDLLYAVSSSGGLKLGNRRPTNEDEGRPMTDHEWHVYLWECLSCDIGRAVRCAESSNHDDSADLRAFEEYADGVSQLLRDSYGIES